ncbi:WD repeat-containing protein 91 [Holothuria leucospilota]|uniref:WD repeat-containing protein 91 n=1 Tax=Holothuria leucospilota TaxID=206669 RepID=A0A9Q0YTC8_HOLLE|nr:WD repeat-containing protein 91 [Holothuria leucospilota]
MVEAVERMDELVKDYLLFRGMTNTFKAFEGDLKNDKDRAYRADKIKDQILSYIQTHDLNGLRNLWKHLDRRIFSNLEYTHNANIRRIEISLLRLYVITAVQSSRSEKVTEFFEKMCLEIQTQPEWKEWFTLAFMKNPEQSPTFETYFSKQWQDTLIFSVQNFLSVIFQSMPLPTLLSFDAEQMKMKRLEEENSKLQDQLAAFEKVEISSEIDASVPLPLATTEIPDDFASISGGHNVRDFGTRTIGLKTGNNKSPLVMRKQAPNSAEKVAKGTTNQNLSKSVGVSSGGKGGDKSLFGSLIGQRKSADASVLKPKEATGKKSEPVSAIGASNVAPASNLSNQSRPKSQNKLEEQRKELFQKSKEPASRSPKTSNPKTTQDSTVARKDPVQWQPKETELDLMASENIPTTESIRQSQSKTNQVMSPFIVLSSDEYTEHHSSITHCKFSPTATSVATMDIDGVVKIWSFSPIPTTIATVMYKSPLISMEWVPKQPRMLLLGSSDGTLKMYDTEQKKTFTDVQVDQFCPKIISLACNPVGEVFATAQTSQPLERAGISGERCKSRLLIWDVKLMRPQQEFLLGDGKTCVNSMAFNHNGNLMVTGSSDGCLRLFDVQTSACILEWKSHQGPVHAVNFSPDENSLFSMGADGKFCQWALYNPGKQLEFPIHDGATGPFVMSGYGGYKQQQSPRGKLFAFDSGGKYILTCAPYGGIIYELDSSGHLDQMLTILGHRTPVVSVDWSTSVNTGMCLTGSMDGKVQITTLLSQ